MYSGETSFEPPHPEVIGNYRVLKVSGEGSTGTVYLAEHIDFPQRVAIKLFHPKHRLTHLEEIDQGHEQQLLASLEHGNIVRLIGQGTIENGQAYLVLEHVDGLPITQYCDEHRLSIAARVSLLQKVVAAVSYAHRHLIIHADLKPSNVLVNTSGEPKLLDFGIGARIDEIHASTTSNFTPAFASPEQLRNEPATVASDVYTLGLLGTLLLSGIHARPSSHTDPDDQPGSLPRRLRKLDGSRLAALAEARSTAAAGLCKALTGDLDAILEKALQPHLRQRYASAELLGDDLLAYLSGRPIEARQSSVMERMRKWARRHWAIASLGAALATAILLSVVGVVVQTARAERQRRQAQATLHELVQLTGALDGELYDSIGSLDHAEDARRALISNATQTMDRISADHLQDSRLILALAQQYEKLAQLQSKQSSGASNSQQDRKNALVDVAKALNLLDQLPSSKDTRSEAAKTQSELVALRGLIDRPQLR